MTSWWWRWSPVLACMAAIFFASSQTDVPDLPAGLSNHTGHFIAYGALGVAGARAFAGAAWRGVGWRVCLRAVFLASAYGVTDEVHQMFVPNRYPGMDDWVADTLGAVTGALVVMLVAHLRRSRAAQTRGV